MCGHMTNAPGWTTFPNQRTQYPAQVRVEVYNQCPELPERYTGDIKTTFAVFLLAVFHGSSQL